MTTINGTKMKELLDKNLANTIDVDSEIDFQKTHLTGAINIPYNKKNFTQKVEEEFSNKNENVVLCASRLQGPTLNILAKELETAGYKNVYQYSAGPMDWEDSNLNVEKQR